MLNPLVKYIMEKVIFRVKCGFYMINKFHKIIIYNYIYKWSSVVH